ncbi:MAG TPA: VCBS repeat-containing protein [Thermoleophilaceae bacterium]|nr:VCBS repeat-containing protein [Thermoleophilaceae bacterium]
MRILSTCVSALAVLIAGLAGAASAQAGFAPALGSPFPYAGPTVALAVADGDRNGTVDVVAGGSLSLRRGAGTGFLGNPIAVGATGPVEGLSAGDLNGDGLLDYAGIAPGSTPSAPRQLLRLIATPGNGFAQEVVLADAGDATDVTIADVDGDSLLDIVIVRGDDALPDPEPGDAPGPEPGPEPDEALGRQDVTVVRGGTLDERHHESGIAAPGEVEVADLNGDGRPEILVAGDEPSVSVLVNTGGGGFAAGDLSPTGAVGATRRIALAPVNGDGALDLLATDSGAAAVLALIGDGTGRFQPLGPRATGLPGPSAAVAAGDVNGDGPVDAVVGGEAGFAVLLGDGGGGLSPAPGSPFPTWVAAGDPVDDVVVADMNRDAQLDVVTANRNGSVSVELNADTGLLTAAPTGVDFGTMLPATGTFTQNVTLRAARGRVRLTRLDRQGSRVFDVRDVDCLNRTLLLGQACTVSVTFNAPRRARRYEALLSVDANAAAVVVPLTATTRPPIVSSPRLKRKRVKLGQRLLLRYGLSEGALTRVIVERARPGRRFGNRCVEPRRGNPKLRRCTLWHAVGRTARRDDAGRNRIKIATRGKSRGFGRKRRLGTPYPPGTYRLSISALDRFRNRAEEQTVRFKILRPKPKVKKKPARE